MIDGCYPDASDRLVLCVTWPHSTVQEAANWLALGAVAAIVVFFLLLIYIVAQMVPVARRISRAEREEEDLE